MASTIYLYVLSSLFLLIFFGFMTSAGDLLYDLYKPKQQRSETNTTRSDSAIKTVKETVSEDYHTRMENEDEKKEYEEMGTNTGGNISPLSDHGHNNDSTSTVALAYFLEIQSRLQHLQSLVSSDINENTFAAVSQGHCQENAPRDMISEIHSTNMKLIESVIQNVIYEQSRDTVREAETDFYARLNHSTDTNWSRSRKNKRRPSIEQQIYRNGSAYVTTVVTLLRNSINSIHSSASASAVHLITSATVLYSCGVLYYCIENQVNVGIFAYVFGILLVFMVMCIGYIFNIASVRKNGQNEFIIASVMSGALIYSALFWISHYFNVTSAFILIMAVVLSYQYRHGPIYAKQRNLDEIWVCLLLNCGLPLFSYYLQLPELIKLEFEQKPIEIELPNMAEETQGFVSSNDSDDSWAMSILNVILWILNDFYSMMDLTYALDEKEITVTNNQTNNEININPQMNAGVAAADSDGLDSIDSAVYWFNKLFSVFPYTLFNIILITWFVTHSSMLIRNITLYKTVNTKLLYCMEIIFAYVLSAIFWYNDLFDITLLYFGILSTPWTLGLLKFVWEHKNIQNDSQIAKHTEIFNLWIFIAIYLSFVYNWISQNGVFFSLFSPTLFIVVAPFYFIIQCMPQIVDEMVWATDF